jgi:hypothetical protein
MKYRKLGNTGLIVSEVALGTMQFGGRMEGPPPHSVVRLRAARRSNIQCRAAPLVSRIALNSEVGRHSGHRRELPRSRPIL